MAPARPLDSTPPDAVQIASGPVSPAAVAVPPAPPGSPVGPGPPTLLDLLTGRARKEEVPEVKDPDRPILHVQSPTGW